MKDQDLEKTEEKLPHDKTIAKTPSKLDEVEFSLRAAHLQTL